VTHTAVRGRWARPAGVVAAGTALSLAFGGVALADNITDTIVDTGSVSLVAGSATSSGTAGISVVANNAQDSDQGCNFDTSAEYLELTVATPAGVTATPSSLTFKACGTPQNVTFTASSTAVSGTATVTIKTNATDGSFKNDVSIPITVTRPNTKPSVAVTGVSNGAEYVIGSVPTAGCEITDAEDGNTTKAAVLSGTLTDGLGSQTATCDYTDEGGLKAETKTATYTVVAPPNTKPTVSVTGVTDGASYEFDDVPAAGCAVTDKEDGNSTKNAVVTGTLSHGLGSQTATCDYTDEGGLEADTVSATYTVVDTGKPTITGKISPAGPDGTNGWYRSNPVVTFECADSGSGIDTCEVDGETTASKTLGEGADQSVSGTATDWAGNTATATVPGIDVDLTNPTATFNSSMSGSIYFGSVPAAPKCTATDELSGPDTCDVTGYSTALGKHTLTATATDKAGRTGTATLEYTVLPYVLKGLYSPVDMGGVLNTVKGGSTVPLKFEVFAASELTNTSVVKNFMQKQVSCVGADTLNSDAIEVTSTGGTILRYDSTGGQFIQNWQTPKKPGTCYAVTVTTQDGSAVSANFMLK
jgi:hypothetical protein